MCSKKAATVTTTYTILKHIGWCINLLIGNNDDGKLFE